MTLFHFLARRVEASSDRGRLERAAAVPLLVALVLASFVAVPAARAGNDRPDRVSNGAGIRQIPPATPAAPEAAPDRVIVKFRDSTSPQARQNARAAERLERIAEFQFIGAEVALVHGRTPEQAVAALSRRPDVEYVHLDHRLSPTFDYEDEPLFDELWGLHNAGPPLHAGTYDIDINARQASTVATQRSDIVVAVIDDGVDFSHPDLAGRQWTNPGELQNGVDDPGDANTLRDDVNGWDFCHNDASVHDFNDDWHGTHVAGTIGASLNGQGVVGVAPNVQIMALKFMGTSCYGYTSQAIAAIEYARDNGAHIINASWGGSGNDPALEQAIEASGTLFVTSAGNGGSDRVGDSNDTGTSKAYPAAYDSPNLISVAALTETGELASFSNFGSISVDIGAPGVNVVSSVPADSQGPAGWASSNGTSMAAPHVAGAAALIASVDPSVLADPSYPNVLRRRLLDTGKAVPATSGKTATGRVVDVGRAVGADVTGPVGAVSINRGATISYGPTVQLGLTGSDTAGVTRMRISNSSATRGGVLLNGHTLPFSTTATWSLTNATYGGTTATGTRTVYTQFEDGMGNWSAVRTDAISYTADAPSSCTTSAPLRSLDATHTETIYPSGDVDTFRFQTASSQYAMVTLARPPADYRLDLYNSSCSLLATSNVAGTGFEQIYRYLPAGTYYVRASPTQSGTTSITTYGIRFQSFSNAVHLLSTGAAWKDAAGKMHIPGEVLNSSAQNRTVRVTATLYNSANTSIGSVTVDTLRSVVPSRWRSPFDVVFTPPAGYHHFSITLSSTTTSAAVVTGLATTPGNPTVDGSGARHHPGSVRNDNTYSVRSVQVFATLYDAWGKVVNVGKVTPSLSAGGGWLGSGASTSFDVVVKPHAGVNRHAFSVQAIR